MLLLLYNMHELLNSDRFSISDGLKVVPCTCFPFCPTVRKKV